MPHVLPAGKQLASAAVSLRSGSAGDTDSASKATHMQAANKPSREAGSNAVGRLADTQDKEGAISTQQALDLLDAKDAQTGDWSLFLCALFG